MTSSIALTGASGFIGRHLVDTLLSAGFELRALTRRPDRAGLPEDVVLVPGSLEDETSLARLVDGVDAVVHCAGLIKATHQHQLEQANAAGTRSLARVCAGQGKPPRFIFLSSLAARHPEISDYAASKRRAEDELAKHGDNLDWTIVRPPAVYGPGDKETLQLFQFVRRGVFLVPRVKQARFSLIYVSDLCDALRALLRTPGIGRSNFDVRDGCREGYSWPAVAQAISRCLGHSIRCAALPKSLMQSLATTNQLLARVTGRTPSLTRGKVQELFHDDWVCQDNILAKKTDWRPNVGLDEGIRLTIRWYTDNGWL